MHWHSRAQYTAAQVTCCIMARFLFCQNVFPIYQSLFGKFWFPFLVTWKDNQLVLMNSLYTSNNKSDQFKTIALYWIWLFNTFVVVCLFGAGSPAYVIFKSFHSSSAISFEMVTLSLINFLSTSLISSLSLVLLQSDRDLVNTYNSLQQLSNDCGKQNLPFS